ncbi:MAG: hypothetical protein Kow0068_00190 [Marinilabiliales bacterium]
MKHILLIISVIAISFSTFAQNLPNGDLENWSSIAVGEAPDNWNTDNMDYLGLGFVIIERVYKETTDFYSGTTSARIETQTQNIFGTDYVVPGILSLAAIDWDPINNVPVFTGGLAITNRPAHFRGYYKYTAAGSDSCMIYVTITKWNTGTSTRDTIGEGYFKSSTVSSWTLFNVPINYYTGDIPDSCNIIISSSDETNMTAGSILYVDSMSFTGSVPVNVSKNIPKESIVVYPNPAKDIINIEVNNLNNTTELSIYNTIGNVVFSKTIDNADRYRTKLDVSNLPRGLYFIQTYNGEDKYIKKMILK